MNSQERLWDLGLLKYETVENNSRIILRESWLLLFIIFICDNDILASQKCVMRILNSLCSFHS